MGKRGNCYAASEALYHILGGKAAGWTPMHTKVVGPDLKMDTHWFLRHKSGLLIDPSKRQFQGRSLTHYYKTAIGSGFLTKSPSKRAKKLIKELTWQQT